MGHGEHSSAVAVVFSEVVEVVVNVERGKAVEVVDRSFKLHPPSIRSRMIHIKCKCITRLINQFVGCNYLGIV